MTDPWTAGSLDELLVKIANTILDHYKVGATAPASVATGGEAVMPEVAAVPEPVSDVAPGQGDVHEEVDLVTLPIEQLRGMAVDEGYLARDLRGLDKESLVALLGNFPVIGQDAEISYDDLMRGDIHYVRAVARAAGIDGADVWSREELIADLLGDA